MSAETVIFSHNINDLIKDLAGPSYITDAFSSLEIESLIVLSSVFRPDKSYLAGYFAKVLKIHKNLYTGKNVLDLGCGSGLLGVVCALNGSQKICFGDINPLAVKNAKINSILFDLANTSFYCGSLFENNAFDEKFDLIIFNSPSISGIPANDSEAALVREDLIIESFYGLAPKFLKGDGCIIMPGSSRFDSDMSPINMVKKLKLKYEFIDKEWENDGNFKYVILIKYQTI